MKAAFVLLFAALFLAQEKKPPPFSAVLISVSPDVLRVEPGKRPTNAEQAKFLKFTSIEKGVLFDTDGDGTREAVAWTDPKAGVAFLALDRDGNGEIDSGKELFGGATMPGKWEGFGALLAMSMAAMDGKVSAFVSEGHPLYRKLLLWMDENHNGVSEPSELRRASEFFTEIGLGYGDFKQTDAHGNQFRFAGWTTVRTAPGLNSSLGGNPRERHDHLDRLRQFFDVALAAVR
jgi:hypothetical protein